MGASSPTIIKLRSDRIDATAIVVADIAKGTYTGALKGRVNDYRSRMAWAAINVVTDAHLVSRGPKRRFWHHRAGFESRRGKLDQRLGRATQLGGNAVITADVGYDQHGVASVRQSAPDRTQVCAIAFGGRGQLYLPDGRDGVQGGSAISADYGPVTRHG